MNTPPHIMLGVIGNGRGDLLSETVASLEQMVNYPFFKKVMIDDTGDADYAKYLKKNYGWKFDILSHPTNRGLSGSIRTLWASALLEGADYVFHMEEDFTFNQPINLNNLLEILQNTPHLAQVSLTRQPVNADEVNAGGVLQFHLKSPTDHGFKGLEWVQHRTLFTLNPSLYPRWVMEHGWEQGWGEAEFSESLFKDPDVQCGCLGRVNDLPLVTHTGNYRGSNWFV